VVFLDAYLEIERVRFEERLTIVLDVDPAVLSAEVPNLILQPIVENAVRHGFASHSPPGEIRVAAQRRGSLLEVTVSLALRAR
jgi:two-component system, LytTR family, sensor kinase